MTLLDIRGLKFPDAYVTRFFFKMGLDRHSGEVLELGCGNGNNLQLFSAYGWRITGIDRSPDAIEDAAHNLRKLGGDEARMTLLRHDISAGLPDMGPHVFDCLLLPNIVCYLKRADWLRLLEDLAEHLAPGAAVFLRTRSLRDYRYGRGVQVEPNTFHLATPETGEAGLINTFYTEHELVGQLLHKLHIDPETLVTLHVDFQNLQRGLLVSNSDIVLWGRTK